MLVSFYPNFSKRPNSTEQPPQPLAVSVQCQLKDETSFLRPSLKIVSQLTAGAFAPNAFTYAYIPQWQRYYYVQDWQYINACWECSLMVDVLASFKTEIGLTSAYIVRSASTYNGNIIDGFYPTTSVKNISNISISSPAYQTTIPGGTFVIGVINADTTNNLKVGAVTYYALDITEMQNVMAYLFSSNIYQVSNITEIGEGLYKSLFDPFQYIVSCMWFPFPKTTFGNASDTADVKVGYWSTGVTGRLVRYIVKEEIYRTYSAIPTHPQSSRGNYVNFEPFTRLTAYYPPFGEIPIDTTFLQYGTNNYLRMTVNCDFVTGIAELLVSITNGYQSSVDTHNYFTMRTAQIGVPVQIAQIMSDFVTAGSNLVHGVGSLLQGNLGALFDHIVSGVEAAMPKLSTQGANGSMVEIIETPVLVIEHAQLVNDDNTEFGKPLCQVRMINTLSGYVQCGEGDHQFSGTKQEIDEINEYLRSGFFYE